MLGERGPYAHYKSMSTGTLSVGAEQSAPGYAEGPVPGSPDGPDLLPIWVKSGRFARTLVVGRI
jgi:hypothetical protein